MKKIVTGSALLVLCFILPFLAIIPFLFIKDHSILFTGPGSTEITVTEAKKYYLWNQYEGSLEGKSFSGSEEFPDGASFILTEKDSKDAVTFHSDSSISTSLMDSKRKSIGYFQVPTSGSYELTISNLPEERLFSWSPSPFENAFAWIAGLVVLGSIILLCAVGGVVLIIIGIVDLSKKANPGLTGSQPPPSMS